MKEAMITFRSVTPAQRGEGILQRAGIGCSLRRTPRQLEDQGCGYCLRLKQGQLHLATELLQAKGVPFRKIYVQQANGSLEELCL